jgi:serine O-acetyltransferase
LTLLYRFLFRWVEWTCGITLPYTVLLGRRVRIWHHGGIILHARSIGDDVQIRQNTTFGNAGWGVHEAIPTIGDRADIGCGVCISGDITIGDDCRIGANSLVITDVPSGATAAGVPASIVRRMNG